MKRIATAFVAGVALAGSSALVQAQTDPRVDCTQPGMGQTAQCRGSNQQQQPGAAHYRSRHLRWLLLLLHAGEESVGTHSLKITRRLVVTSAQALIRDGYVMCAHVIGEVIIPASRNGAQRGIRGRNNPNE